MVMSVNIAKNKFQHGIVAVQVNRLWYFVSCFNWKGIKITDEANNSLYFDIISV